MQFNDILNDFSWEDIGLRINNFTKHDVERALNKTSLDIEDFLVLISPAAEPFIEEMAKKSRDITLRRFGKTIQLYLPLYLSNDCTNHCVYCGFNHNNKFERKVLNSDEILREIEAIKEMHYEHILLVTGESSKVGIDYFSKVFDLIREYFSLISIEVQPLEEEGYLELIKKGLNTVYLYQETYNRENYKNYHPAGKKSDFQYRLDSYERMGRAGVHKIGLGILLGLEDWRVDSFFTAMHLRYLRKKYWKTKYSVSFPRLRPYEGSFKPNYEVSDRQLLQLICAYRIFDEDVELSLSTREMPDYRDNVFPLGITSMSAGSRTQPGGYANKSKLLEQFEPGDNRTPDEVANVIKSKGYEVVWKDWDAILQNPQ